MSDPEVIGDRVARPRSGAPTARSSRRTRWRRSGARATSDAAGARELLAEDGDDPEMREMLERAEARLAELEEEIRLAMVEPDPNDDKNVIVEVRGGAGGEEAGLFAGDLYRMLSRYAERRGFKHRGAVGRRRRLHVRGQGPGRVQRVQARGRHPPRAARARDRVAGPHPHLHRHGGGAARGRGGGGRDRPQRPADRRLPLLGPGRPVGEHHRLRRAHHAQADRPGGVDAGREVAAPEPREGDARAARAAAGGASGRRSRPRRRPSGARRWAPASARRRSAPTTSPRTA